jgi:hypothetical protein
MKSLNIDIIFPWEVGLIIVILGIITIIIGIKQSKQKPFDDLDKLPLTKPATKIFFGTVALIFGSIQLLPILK